MFEAGWKERQWKWPLVPGENGYVGSATYSLDGFRYGGSWWDPYNYPEANIAKFPIQMPRSAENYPRTFWWYGKLANDSQIAPGEYKYVPCRLLASCASMLTACSA